MTETGKFSTSGYLPDGRRVFFELPVDATTAIEYAMAFCARLTAAGITVHEQGVEAGEKTDDIYFVSRRVKINNDGTETPIVDLYNDKFKFAHLKIYLNTDDDVRAFESATGLQLASLPVYEGDNAVERNTPKAPRYIRQLAAPARIVWKDNPNYTEGGKTPKRIFLRWLGYGDKGESGSVENNPILGANSGNPEMLHDLIVTAVSVAKPGNYRLTAWTSDEKEIQVFTLGHDLFRSWGLPEEKWLAWDNAGGGTVKFPANVTYVTSAQWQRAKDAKTENDGYWLAVIPVTEAF